MQGPESQGLIQLYWCKQREESYFNWAHVATGSNHNEKMLLDE